MSLHASTPPPVSDAPAPACAAREPAADIDASLRWPLLALAAGAAAWLMAGSFLSVIAAIKLHAPDFLSTCPLLSLGRVRPAAVNCLLYGFASQGALALMLWMLSRLGGTRFAFAVPALVAAGIWNLGVAVGVGGILGGASTGFEWLEVPRAAAGLLFVAYAALGICAVLTFQARRVCELYPSQWFLLAALFWFPWIFTAANYLLLQAPVRGTLQAVVNGWFTGGFAQLWLGPVALAALYYFLPRLSGQALYSRELAGFAFWTLLAFGGFAGLTGLIGGPVPRWMPAVSTAATVCLLLPLACNVANWHLTLSAGCQRGMPAGWKANTPLCFLLLGAFAYGLCGLLNALVAFPQVAERLNLTYFTAARQALFLHGFIGTVVLGALYAVLPGVVRGQWASPKLVNAHFYCTLVGVALVAVGLGLAGWTQGTRLANPSVALLDVVKGTAPFLGLSTLGFTLLLLGQCCFALNLVKLLRAACDAFCRPLCEQVCGCGGSAANAGVKS